MIVLDTNVVSERMRGDPSPAVLQWLSGNETTGLVITALTKAELMLGVGRMPRGRRQEKVLRMVAQVLADYHDSILAFDTRAAAEYARVKNDRDAMGRPISVFDAQIAAICASTGATLATRNTKDFDGLGLDVIDPWQA